MSDEQVQNPADILDKAAAKPVLALAEIMPKVAADFGKPLGGQLKDLLSLCVRGNKLSIEEYYQMRLFDDASQDVEAKKRFVGLQKSREIWTALMAVNRYTGLVDDKLAYEKFMRAFGFDMPETVAIAGGHYPESGVTVLRDAAALRGFLSSASFPLFGKPVNSNQSLGSARLEAFDAADGTVTLANGSTLDTDTFWARITEDFGGEYLFQNCVRPHAEMASLCGGGLPTVRVVTLDRGNGPELYRAVMKLTGNGNVADNFWREGNLLATVDCETGTLGKALDRMGVDGIFHASHPGTGEAIEGRILPHWADVKRVALDAMRLLPGTAIFGFDIAIGADGPVIVEANNDPHLVMMQIAHGEGVLDAPMLETLAHVAQRQKDRAAFVKKTLADERAKTQADLKSAAKRKAA